MREILVETTKAKLRELEEKYDKLVDDMISQNSVAEEYMTSFIPAGIDRDSDNRYETIDINSMYQHRKLTIPLLKAFIFVRENEIVDKTTKSTHINSLNRGKPTDECNNLVKYAFNLRLQKCVLKKQEKHATSNKDTSAAVIYKDENMSEPVTI